MQYRDVWMYLVKVQLDKILKKIRIWEYLVLT